MPNPDTMDVRTSGQFSAYIDGVAGDSADLKCWLGIRTGNLTAIAQITWPTTLVAPRILYQREVGNGVKNGWKPGGWIYAQRRIEGRISKKTITENANGAPTVDWVQLNFVSQIKSSTDR